MNITADYTLLSLINKSSRVRNYYDRLIGTYPFNYVWMLKSEYANPKLLNTF